MLQSVQVRNDLGAFKVTLPVGKPASSQSYFIKSIDGLGPTDASIAMSTFANYDGSVYHTSRANRRNILITVGYSPNYAANQDVSTLRKQMYKNFPPKSEVDLRFIDSKDETLRVTGRVENVRPNVFTKDPEIVISILCPDAYMSSVATKTLPSLASWSYYTMSTYVGDVEIGFNLIMNVTTAFGYMRIIPRTNVEHDIRITYPFLAGDVIRVSTVPGNKYASVTRGATTTSLLEYMKGYTLVGNLSPDSQFQLQASGGNTYSLTFMPKWLGV